MPRHPEVLTDLSNSADDYRLETPQPEQIPGSSPSRAVYIHKETKERWLATSPVQQETLLTRRLLLREKIANDIYAYYGVAVPRLALADLPCQYVGIDDNTPATYTDELVLTEAPHLLSCWLNRFNGYGYMPIFTTGQAIMKLNVNDQFLPEQGLGRILAVAHFIHDVDVIGSSGDNIGYKLSLTAQGELCAQSCKIDPGEAFFEFDKPESKTASRHIRLATSSSQTYITFEKLPERTRREFIHALQDILATPGTDIARFFGRKGAEALEKDFTPRVIEMLTARQVSFRLAFKRELEAAKEEKTREEKTPSPIAALPDTLKPLYAQALLEQSSPIFQQAQQFYLEPGTTHDGEKDSKQQPFQALMTDFLKDEKNKDARILLLLGDSGFGKSTATQQILQQQWENYLKEAKSARVTIRIELKQFTRKTVSRCVENALLDDYHLTSAQIAELKKQPCLILLDGFDEIGEREKCNLWDTNGLSEWSDVRLIVTCRNAYLEPSDRAKYFYPAGEKAGLWERYLAAFTPEQIEKYLAKLLDECTEKEKASFSQWIKKQFQKSFPSEQKLSFKLTDSEHLQELLQVPLILKLFGDALPALKEHKTDLMQLNHYQLYDIFIQQWFEHNRTRLSQQIGKLSPVQCQAFSRYSQNLAVALFKAKRMQIEYFSGYPTWDEFFSKRDQDIIRLRSVCLLRQVGNQCGFIHKSFVDFFWAQRLVHCVSQTGEDLTPLVTLLGTRTLVAEPQLLLFLYQARLAGKLSETALAPLFAIIKYSADHAEIAVASANAATILNACRVNLSHQSWRKVQLPGADLRYALLAHTDLREANLSGAFIHNTILYQSNLADADLRGVQWNVAKPLTRRFYNENSLAFTLDGTQLAFSSGDTVQLWDVGKGIPQGAPLKRHTHWAVSAAFSPGGTLLAIGCEDNTVQLWDVARSIARGAPLKGHRGTVDSIAFSPDGTLLASVNNYHDDYSCKSTVQFWKVSTRKIWRKPLELDKYVYSIAFSPDGTLLAIGCDRSTIEFWNIPTGTLQSSFNLERGNKGVVKSLAFSPDGTRLVSACNSNYTLQLWQIGKKEQYLETLQWHVTITSVAMFDPGKSHIFSSQAAKTVPGCQPEEDGLAISDIWGCVSFWAVSRRTHEFRFLGMPPHPAMPLLVTGLQLNRCRLDPQGKSLLAQYGATVQHTLVEELKKNPPELLKSPPVTPDQSSFGISKTPKRHPLKTPAGGDCAFHALFGVWDEKHQQVICPKVEEKRQEAAKAIAESKDTSTVRPLIHANIRELILSRSATTSTQIKALQQRYQQFLEEQESTQPQIWKTFAQQLRRYPAVMEFILAKNITLDIDDTTLRKAFYAALNREEGVLYGLMLSLPELQTAFEDYNQCYNASFDLERLITVDVIKEYAQLIEQPHNWLLPSEIQLLAQVFDVRVAYYASPATQEPDDFNPRGSTRVAVQFNGRDHFEQLRENELPDSKTLAHDTTYKSMTTTASTMPVSTSPVGFFSSPTTTPTLESDQSLSPAPQTATPF